MAQVAPDKQIDARWKDLYRVGGAAALLSVLLIPLQIFIFVDSLTGGVCWECLLFF